MLNMRKLVKTAPNPLTVILVSVKLVSEAKLKEIKAMTQITLSTPRNYTELEGYQYFDIRILKDGEEIGNVTAIVPPEGENRDSTYIESIGIDEAHRNRGYGTQALHLLKDLYGNIHLAPTDEHNQRLYERVGEEAHWELGDVDQGYGVYSL